MLTFDSQKVYKAKGRQRARTVISPLNGFTLEKRTLCKYKEQRKAERKITSLGLALRVGLARFLGAPDTFLCFNSFSIGPSL